MSLINDALKRAKESQPKNPPGGAPPLPPIESSPSGGANWILILAGILFLAAIVLCISALVKYKSAPAPMTVAQETVAVPSIVKTQEAAVAPMPPKLPDKTAEKLPQVQGILFDAVNPMAIVNRQTVRIGDRIGVYKIQAISQNSVTFQRDDGSLKEIKIGG